MFSSVSLDEVGAGNIIIDDALLSYSALQVQWNPCYLTLHYRYSGTPAGTVEPLTVLLCITGTVEPLAILLCITGTVEPLNTAACRTAILLCITGTVEPLTLHYRYSGTPCYLTLHYRYSGTPAGTVEPLLSYSALQVQWNPCRYSRTPAILLCITGTVEPLAILLCITGTVEPLQVQ